MNLGFAHPLLLWGFLAAALPILIHLINRRRARLVPFAPLSFVKLSNQKLARAFKLKQFLLVLLRVLAILALVAWLAWPKLMPEGKALPKATKTQGATAWVVLLDQSFSMRAEWQGRSLFEHAKRQAREWLGERPESDSFALLPVPLPENFGESDLSFDRLAFLNRLDGLKAGYGRCDFSSALLRARVLLAASPAPNKRLLIIGNFKAAGYDADFSLGGLADLGVVTRDVREGRSIANNAILDLSATRFFQTGPEDWKVEVKAARYATTEAKGLALSILADDASVADGFVDLPAKGTVSKSFVVRLPPEKAKVALKAVLAPDALPEDNERSLPLGVSRGLKALLVDGVPSSVRHEDETFYLREALDPGGFGRSQIATRVVLPEELGPESFAAYDVVFLCQLPRIAPEIGRALKAFVEKGGALVIGVGPAVDALSYNAELLPLLPGTLRNERVAGNPTAEAQNPVVYLSRLDYQHPALRLFTEETAHSLTIAPVRSYLTFDPDATQHKRVLAEFSDRSPALVETNVGKGRVLFFASSLSRAWNELPIQPGFLPLVQELTRALVLREEGAQTQRTSVALGERPQWPREVEPKEVQDPRGERLALERDGAGLLRPAKPLNVAGVYTVIEADKSWRFAAVAPITESDLTPLEASAIDKLAPGLVQSAAEADPQSAFMSLAPYAVWLLLLLLLGEAFLAERLSH